MNDPRFAKAVVFVNAALPLAIIATDWWNDRLGANPLEFFTNSTGLLTLIFLTLSLAVTPLRKLTGWNFLSHFRRMLGLYAFFYGVLHLLAFVWFDHFFDARAVAADVVKRPFVTFGMLGLLLMVPLAVTSTNAAVKRMGAKRWKLLHRLAYGSAVAGVVHYWLKVKVVTTLPLAFALIVTILLLYRVVEAVRPRRRAKAKAPATPQQAAA
jgi:DMSO/TMAO reductase YedYZ heme-binding membrane subunit